MRNVVVFTIFSLFIFLLSASYTQAATLYFDPAEAVIHRGDTITVSLRIDTDEGECINTVDAVIHYDANIRAVDVSRGDSILSLWVEDPTIDETNHTITFAGGLPGGYCGRIAGDPSLTNVIAEIVFRSPGLAVGVGDNPVARVWLSASSSVLLHDGLGTRSDLRLLDASFSLLATPGPASEDSWRGRVNEDTIPPADFSVIPFKDETAFSGRYFISFSTQDKQSGIDHYEVMEEPIEDLYAFRWGAVDAPWVIEESPYVLKDQSLNSTIRVKAIDKAGNETIAVWVPEEALRKISSERIVTWSVIGGIGILFLCLLGYALWRRKQRLIEQYEHEPNP